MADRKMGPRACMAAGFTDTSRRLDRLNVEDELQLDMTDPDFILRNVDLASSSCGQTAAIAEGYEGRKEVQRLVCSQSLFVAGFLPSLFERMADIDKKAKTMALNGPLIGIIGAGGQLGSALTQSFLDNGWSPFRLAVCGRGGKKLKGFEAQGIGVFDSVAVLVRAVKLVIVAVGPQHARQVGSMLGEAGTSSRLVLSTLAGISEASLRRVLGAIHLLQTRVDMAGIDTVEMGKKMLSNWKGSPPASLGSSDDRGAIGGNVADTTWPASDSIRDGQERQWQDVHDRAARHVFPDARAGDRMIGTLQLFFEDQGLDKVDAFQACRDWLSPSKACQQHDKVGESTGLLSRSSTQHQLPDGGKRNMRDAEDDGGGWRPSPPITWPPSDLVRIKAIHSEILNRSYADALRKSGYQCPS